MTNTTIDGDRQGCCIPATYEDMIKGTFKDLAERGEVVAIHGWVYSHKLDRMIKHSWIDFVDKDIIYEPVNRVIITKQMMRETFKAEEVKRYTYWELIKLSLKTRMKGGEFEF